MRVLLRGGEEVCAPGLAGADAVSSARTNEQTAVDLQFPDPIKKVRKVFTRGLNRRMDKEITKYAGWVE